MSAVYSLHLNPEATSNQTAAGDSNAAAAVSLMFSGYSWENCTNFRTISGHIFIIILIDSTEEMVAMRNELYECVLFHQRVALVMMR